MGHRVLRLALAFAAWTASACDSGPTGPGPNPASPQITCGAPLRLDVVGLSQQVNYPAPAIMGGAAPVNLSCAPASGSAFPLGATTVNCTATDAQSRTASCAFTVTLTHRPLATTKFVAFGDSLTAGENGRPVNFMPVVDLANAYPTYLQQFFNDRIPTQTFTVVNAGLGGERVVENDTRLKDAIARHQPQVLLLLEGINDLNNGAGAQTVVNGLRDSIRTARDRGVQYVFVSTLLPVARDVCGTPPPRCRATDTPIPVLLQTNDLIRAMVPSNGAHLVDRYDEFLANRATYIDVDGLHMRPDGYRGGARAFWERGVQVIPPAQLFGS